MATYRHWSVSLWRDPDDVWNCRILSPDITEWWLISATLCGWRRCFVADKLWLMKRIRKEEDDKFSLYHTESTLQWLDIMCYLLYLNWIWTKRLHGAFASHKLLILQINANISVIMIEDGSLITVKHKYMWSITQQNYYDLECLEGHLSNYRPIINPISQKITGSHVC